MICKECIYRRLAAKVCLRPYIPRLGELLQPTQLQGCKAAVHATCSFMAQTQSEKVLMLKMPSIASAETQFFKHLRHTSQKSILSYGTVILQKHFSFIESSALTQPLVYNKGTLLA